MHDFFLEAMFRLLLCLQGKTPPVAVIDGVHVSAKKKSGESRGKLS